MPAMQGLEMLKQKKYRLGDMKLQKFGVKLFLDTNGSFDLKDFIPVFHNWIQDKVIYDHLLIDVADYSHIPDGPGIMLIAHEGHFSLDQESYKPGIMYMRKTDIDGDFKQRFVQVLTTTIQAANCLRNNNINKKINFINNSFRFIANDRLFANNTIENQTLYQDKIQNVLAEVYPESRVEYEDLSGENERLAFTVNFSNNINIIERNE